MPFRFVRCCLLSAGMLAASYAGAQTSPAAADTPKVQLNFLNVCQPSKTEIEEMGRALARVKEKPKFSPDFEIARGITTLTEAEARATGARPGPSSWVRIRHDFPDSAPLTDAQYALTVDAGSSTETLALHLRDSKEVLQVLISDEVPGGGTQALQTNTPPTRIRIERFGKSSIVLARCSGVDQTSYEPMFQTAGDILGNYRAAMAIRTVVPAELAHLPRNNPAKAPPSSGGAPHPR